MHPPKKNQDLPLWLGVSGTGFNVPMSLVRVPVVTDKQLVDLRLSSLGLATPAAYSGAAESLGHVDRMLAVQGQDLGGTLWAIGARSANATLSEVQGLFNSGELVKSWPFRGTLHVMTARNAGLIMEYMAPRRAATMAKWQAETELSAEVVQRARDVLREALPAGVSLSRAEVFALLAQEGFDFVRHRLRHLVFQACLYGDIVWGPIEGGEQHLVAAPWRLDTSLCQVDFDNEVSRLAAETEIVRGYIRGRGPVTVADVCYWSGLGKGVVSGALTRLGPELIEVPWAGEAEPLFMLAAEFETAASASFRPSLLNSGFDEFLLGYKTRVPQLARGRIDDVVPGKNGVFKPTIVHRGKVVGVWSRATRASGVEVKAQLFAGSEPSAAVVRGVESHSARMARFYGQDLTVSFG